MCAVICKVIDKRKMKNQNVQILKENLLGALTYKIPNSTFVILQHEIKEMQMKFGDMIYMAKTSVYDFNSLFRDHLPGYSDYMNVKVYQDYSENGMHIINCVLDKKNDEFHTLLNNKRLIHKYGREEVSKNTADTFEIKIPIEEFDKKYRKSTNTLALSYIIKHDKIPYSKKKLLVDNAPKYIHGFWYITNNSKLEMLVKYTKEEEGKYLRKFLDNGGLKNDEFIHMGII